MPEKELGKDSSNLLSEITSILRKLLVKVEEIVDDLRLLRRKVDIVYGNIEFIEGMQPTKHLKNKL